MNESTVDNVKLYVVFTKANFEHWVFRFMYSEMQHCYTMQKSEGGQFWLVVESHNSHMKAKMVTVDDYPHPRLYAGDDAVIVPVKTTIDVTNRRWTLCVFNCVEVVKAMLGIKSFWTWTPYQLYKLLTGGTKCQRY